MFMTGFLVLLQFFGGILYANLLEWIAHKYILHQAGRNKKSFFAFHWHVHHRVVRKNSFVDAEYKIWFWEKMKTRGAEILGLSALVLSHVWVVFISPAFFLGSLIWTFVYYFVHKKAHIDVEWGKRWLRWHYDHHMGLDQDKNWCVTIPIWDYILGTRQKYNYDEKGRVLRP